MSGEYIDFECAECGDETHVKYGEEEKNDDGNLICEDCSTTAWEDLDFPIWIEYESYNDTFILLDNFCHQTGLQPDEVRNQRQFKYTVFTVWYKVTETCSIEGPYGAKEGEKI